MANKWIWMSMFTIGLFGIQYLILDKYLYRKIINDKLFKQNGNSKNAKAKSPNIFDLLFQKIKKKLVALTPKSVMTRLQNLVETSSTKYELEDIIAFKMFLASALFLLFFFLSLGINGMLKRVLIIIVSPYIGYRLPDMIIKRNTDKRKKSIKRALPAFIDNLTICIESGLGFDLSVFRVISIMHGPLSEEIAKTMAEIKYGKSKKDAYRNLCKRLEIPEVTAFFNSLINGEQSGISLGSILRTQSQQLREKKKQQIEERAYKVSIKLVIPLVFFILPGIFIVLLGPALINVMKTMF